MKFILLLGFCFVLLHHAGISHDFILSLLMTQNQSTSQPRSQTVLHDTICNSERTAGLLKPQLAGNMLSKTECYVTHSSQVTCCPQQCYVTHWTHSSQVTCCPQQCYVTHRTHSSQATCCPQQCYVTHWTHSSQATCCPQQCYVTHWTNSSQATCCPQQCYVTHWTHSSHITCCPIHIVMLPTHRVSRRKHVSHDLVFYSQKTFQMEPLFMLPLAKPGEAFILLFACVYVNRCM